MYGTQDGRVSFANSLVGTVQSTNISASQTSLTTSQAPIMSLNENGYSVSLSIASTNISTASIATVSNHEARAQTSAVADQTIDNKTSLVYSNAWQNVDLEYVLVSNNVKENIIVKAPSAEYSYAFFLTLDGLVPELGDDGIVILKDKTTDKTVYYMPAPYMYDAEGETSYDVEYTLAEIKNGNYILTVMADSEWINNTQRTFPVTIDPTINSTATVYDTYICSTIPDANYGYDENLLVTSIQTAFIAIQMPSLPIGATVTNANLNLSYYLVGSGDSVVLRFRQVLQHWTERSLTYIYLKIHLKN